MKIFYMLSDLSVFLSFPTLINSKLLCSITRTCKIKFCPSVFQFISWADLFDQDYALCIREDVLILYEGKSEREQTNRPATRGNVRVDRAAGGDNELRYAENRKLAWKSRYKMNCRCHNKVLQKWWKEERKN